MSPYCVFTVIEEFKDLRTRFNLQCTGSQVAVVLPQINPAVLQGSLAGSFDVNSHISINANFLMEALTGQMG